MAASDPAPSVPTPTGTLAGLAAFPWDGTAWQPTGRAVPSVATPTGVLRGVAPFGWNGSAWIPAGAAKPSVATPSGTLDGVAVYTWSGSAWTPTGGTPDVPTPTGTLQGVAAFYFDGTSWQPAGQAAPEIATPSGVLMGAAMFGWSGAAWTAAPSLDLNFLTGALDSRITFTRASSATYFDATGTLQTAANNVARFDHDPNTLMAKGLLIEEARTNALLQSADLSNAAWSRFNIGTAAAVVTANATTAPDGTATAAQFLFPAVSSAGTNNIIAQSVTGTAATWSGSLWLKGSVGGEQIYIYIVRSPTYYRLRVTLTTSWQRFSVSGLLTATTGWYLALGCDLNDAGQSAIAAQTIYAWGGQFEAGAFPTSDIPTTSASVTRAADVATMAVLNGFSGTNLSFAAEFVMNGGNNRRVIGDNAGTEGPLTINASLQGASFDGTSTIATANALTIGATAKLAMSLSGTAGQVALNAGTVAAGTMSAGFGAIATLKLMGDSTAGDTMSGYLRRVRYWPRALSSAELQQVTT